MNPETSGSMIQCSIPTWFPTTSRSFALKCIVIIVSSFRGQHQIISPRNRNIHEDSPSQPTPSISLTLLLAPSHATTCREQISYIDLPDLSSTTVITRSPRFQGQPDDGKGPQALTCLQLTKEWFFRTSTTPS